MAFEIYRPRKGKKEKQAIVSISRNSLVLNKFAREQLNSDSVDLAYDAETNRIKISPSSDGFVINKTKVHAADFFAHFSIEEKGKFETEYNKDNQSIYVDLDKSI